MSNSNDSISSPSNRHGQGQGRDTEPDRSGKDSRTSPASSASEHGRTAQIGQKAKSSSRGQQDDE
ncbi:MAG: hypothetical protein P4M15_01165 [Alphaproteobacteria bacterium]|nr:hypothetical protein [Alphaproteobacteria bacterium]